jgi:hypothetical protein
MDILGAFYTRNGKKLSQERYPANGQKVREVITS